jgi:NADPH2:quinone reductase
LGCHVGIFTVGVGLSQVGTRGIRVIKLERVLERVTMRAIQVSKTGGPEVLELVDLPVPKPGAGQVLVKVEATGVNFIDTYFREGRYAAELPFVPGQEAAGTVVALGAEVVGFRVGDRVAWNGTRGTYAEFACAPATDLLKIPEAMSFELAAAVLLQGLTAHYLAFDTHAIQAGETVLIHAGAGGVGLLLTQMAKRCGGACGSCGAEDYGQGVADAVGALPVARMTKSL